MTENRGNKKTPETISPQPRFHQRANAMQAYGTVNHLLPLELEEPVRLEMTAQLNQVLAERIQLLGGVSIAMAPDVAETTQIERPPRGREEVPVHLSRLLDAHQVIIGETRKLARRASQLGDDGTNDLLISEVLRTNELQVWFLSEHLVGVPLVRVKSAAGAA